MPLETAAHRFNWKAPDYVPIFEERIRRLQFLREAPERFAQLKAMYADDPIQFIEDWGVTIDPRNVEIGRESLMPFLLFPKQREFLEWILGRWHDRRPGVADKSRDSGMSWLVIALGATLCLFHNGMVIGYGSRKKEYVDERDQPKALFWKARMFLQHLPEEFLGGWDIDRHAPQNRITFPATGSAMTGEIGDQIGRGDRAGIYFVDEAAFLERPLLVENSLSQTTNCRIDISTPNGVGNPFYQKVHGGKVSHFRIFWRDDPRKDEAWYQRQVEDLDPLTVAQEIDIDYTASVTGVLIPHRWILAAVDACEKLGIKPTGERRGALDVADEGRDLNAFCGAHGVQIEHLDEWSGIGDDIFGTVERAFGICAQRGYRSFKYDGDGLGAGVRGDARILNEEMVKHKLMPIKVTAFRGSAAVLNPEKEDVKGRKNEDYFANRKAQAAWALRTRFQMTYRWVVEGRACDPDAIISIPAKLPFFTKLISELSQPTYTPNPGTGKIVVNKAPDGAKSPNLYDAVMIEFSGDEGGLPDITDDMLATARRIGGRRR